MLQMSAMQLGMFCFVPTILKVVQKQCPCIRVFFFSLVVLFFFSFLNLSFVDMHLLVENKTQRVVVIKVSMVSVLTKKLCPFAAHETDSTEILYTILPCT